MSKQRYYEAHITLKGDPAQLGPYFKDHIDFVGWRFSAIEGDANLGDGVKCYLTRQMNTRIGYARAIEVLMETAMRAHDCGIPILRRKIELVLWDDRISDVPCAAEECVACPSST